MLSVGLPVRLNMLPSSYPMSSLQKVGWEEPTLAFIMCVIDNVQHPSLNTPVHRYTVLDMPVQGEQIDCWAKQPEFVPSVEELATLAAGTSSRGHHTVNHLRGA